ncbi:MAG TPA: GerMN domain-containing protein [Candidatus Koribacter sp.]|jgi:spore germination protein GerM
MIPRHLKFMALVLVVLAVVLGYSFFWLKHKAEHKQTRIAQDALPVAPPVTGPTSTATLYVADDHTGLLTRTTVTIPLPPDSSERTQQILRNLLTLYQTSPSPHAIGEGSDVKDVYFVKNGLVVVDFNNAFADKHPSGILAEELTVASIVATLRANNPQIEKVKILVEGKDRETLAGHADLETPLDAANFTQVVKDLQ